MKLRFKILLVVLPLTIAPLFAMGWIAYGELATVQREKAFEEMHAATHNLGELGKTLSSTAAANIELFARNISVRKYVLTEDEDERYSLLQSPLLRTFRGFQEAFPDYYEIRILLPDGYEDIQLVNRDIANLDDEEHNNPVFVRMRENVGQITQQVYLNPDNDEISLFVGKPLKLHDPAVDAISAEPQLRAYLALTVALDDIRTNVETAIIGTSGYLLATDPRGRVVFSSANSGAPAHLDARTRARALEHEHTRAAHRDTHSPYLAMIDDTPVYLHGSEVLPGLYLYAALPKSDLLASSLRLALIVAGITLVTIALTTIALYLALKRLILRPVSSLRGLARDIGRGQLEVCSSLTGNDEMGELARAFEDMAANLRRSDEHIRFIAYHDSLTGLPNRAMFGEYLNRVLADARRHDRQFALLFLDIDDFKRVNDTLGHQAGDQLLQEVTERLAQCLRKADYVARIDQPGEPDEILARLGGDEFVVLMPDINGSHAPSTLANRLLSILSRPFKIEEHEFYIGASIGITLFPSDGLDAETLTKNADIAMYHAKEQGKNDYRFYLQSMNILAHERLALENKLRKALSSDELSLFYQPQVDTLTGEIVGMEALLRWDNPEEGRIPPGVFIPVAEETGLILDIGEWVINEACRQSHIWQKAGLPGIPVSVNVSGQQFGKQDLSRLIGTALLRNRLDPHLLEIEITESAIMENPDRAVTELASIKALGVGIALDDFGTGYSSFSYLHRFPIDTLKIDKSFIHTIDESEDRSELVAAIIAMAHILKLRVVAEGIETGQQLNILAERKCDVIQGFLFQPPVPAEQIPTLLIQRFLETA